MRFPLITTDLKPENILLSDINTDHPTVKIGDLGLGKQASLVQTWHYTKTK